MNIIVIFAFDANKPLEVAPKEHSYNDIALIIINYHLINVNILRSIQNACAKTADEYDGLTFPSI